MKEMEISLKSLELTPSYIKQKNNESFVLIQMFLQYIQNPSVTND